MKFQLNIRKHCFTLIVVEHYNRLPGKVVASLSLEIFQTQLNMVLGNVLQLVLLQKGIGLDGLMRALPPQFSVGVKLFKMDDTKIQ